MRRTARLLVPALLVSTLFAGSARADRLVTSDGRVLQVRKARPLDEDTYLLTFDSLEIECPARFIASVEVEGDMSDYEPKDDNERKMLEKGYVRYQGKWMSKPAYETQLKREAEDRRERTDELAAHAQFHNGYETETKHFRIKTNTSPELLEYYADLLEAYYKLIDREVGIKPSPSLSRTKMRVNIYKNREDWEKNNEAGVGGGVVGYFSFQAESLNFFYDYEDPSFTDWVALHECMHLLTYLIEPQSWPRIWVNEGVADYYGSADILVDKKGKIEIVPGKLQVDRILTVQQAIEEKEYVPLEQLFMVEKRDFSAFEYAHAWSFIYFLKKSKKHEKGFKKFFKQFYTVAKGTEYAWEPFPNKQGTAKILPPEEVRRILLKALKVKDVGKLEDEWIDFVKEIPIDGGDAFFKRGYLVLRRGDKELFEQALKDLNTAIQAGYEEPRAYWVRGLLKGYLQKGGLVDALPDLRKAVELSPLNPRYRYSLGQALTGSKLDMVSFYLWIGEKKQRTLIGDAAQLGEAGEQLALAVELNPENDRYRSELKEFRKLLRRHESR